MLHRKGPREADVGPGVTKNGRWAMGLGIRPPQRSRATPPPPPPPQHRRPGEGGAEDTRWPRPCATGAQLGGVGLGWAAPMCCGSTSIPPASPVLLPRATHTTGRTCARADTRCPPPPPRTPGRRQGPAGDGLVRATGRSAASCGGRIAEGVSRIRRQPPLPFGRRGPPAVPRGLPLPSSPSLAARGAAVRSNGSARAPEALHFRG